jgi:hypothetical protein
MKKYRIRERRKVNTFNTKKNQLIIDNQIVYFDPEFYELIQYYTWRISKGPTNKGGGYVISSIHRPEKNPTIIYMHRLIMNTPKNLQVNHINGNKLDCRKCNMENITLKLHAHKREYHSTRAGYKGVLKDIHTKNYKAMYAGRYLGMYTTPEAAAKVYDKAVKNEYGKEGITNHKLGLLR